MAPVNPIWDYENLARVDLANQEALAELRELDPAAAQRWARKIDANWEKYADIASRLEEHEVYDPEGLELLDELDRKVGKPLLEDARWGLLRDVAKRLGESDIGTRMLFSKQSD